MEAHVLRMFKAPFINYESGGPSLESITFGAENEGAHALLMKVQSSLFSAGGYMSMIRGSFRPEVNKITVPLFMAAGEHDLGAPPKKRRKITSTRHQLNLWCCPAQVTTHLPSRQLRVV